MQYLAVETINVSIVSSVAMVAVMAGKAVRGGWFKGYGLEVTGLSSVGNGGDNRERHDCQKQRRAEDAADQAGDRSGNGGQFGGGSGHGGKGR